MSPTKTAPTPVTVVATIQAYRSSRNETLVPPGGPPSRVIRPPIDFPPDSKRGQLIEEVELDLESDMQELEKAVHVYNIDFQQRIDQVKVRGQVLENLITDEYEQMEESMIALQDNFKNAFQSTFVAMEQKMLSQFARVETTEVPHEEKRIRTCDADARTFFYATVPAIMEKLQGSITRKLEKNHETFDIENAKIQKRERKTESLLDNNERRTLANFVTEKERRHYKFLEREEDFHHVMRVDNRSSEKTQCTHMEVLMSLQQQLNQVCKVREKEDLAILDKLGSSFNHLQSSILENLGETT